MPSYPYYPNARANADGDDLADWTVSDYPVFEKAYNSGASAYRPAAPWGGEVIRTAGPKAPSREEVSRFLMEEAGMTRAEAGRLGARMFGYGVTHPKDGLTALGMLDDDPRTITRKEDAANRRFFQSAPNDPDVQKGIKAYNDAIANGKIRIFP